jgi:hypothetical protein
VIGKRRQKLLPDTLTNSCRISHLSPPRTPSALRSCPQR